MLKVSEDGRLISSGVQVPGLPTQGEAACENEMSSACRSGSDGERASHQSQEAFQDTVCGRRLQETRKVDLDGGRVHGTPVSSCCLSIHLSVHPSKAQSPGSQW